MGKLVLVRHGESQWNLDNRFTGWVDVDLSAKGVEEAGAAGKQLAALLKSSGMEFHHTYTSLLKRAIRTHYLMLESADRVWYPVMRTWRLNERHYGALQGLDKAETAKKYGDAQVKIWRRSYDTLPPMMDPSSEMNPKNDPRYAHLEPSAQPLGESLKVTIDRVMPFWESEIGPRMRKGENLLIVAHGNSLRGLVKHIKKIGNEDILELNIPTAKPWLFEFDSNLNLKSDSYL
ncbi:MAG: 2,3-diphosphoglycerate-dependent phosphoglycerate mutase [Bdellovibrionales bacterium]|nr:2,3-diphosphoglycerate-dependent phosphoglycerate mutase [Bdellovibrionales bacterium]